MKRTRALAAVFATLAVLPVLLIAHAAVSAETSATAHDVKIAAVGYGTITADKTSAVAGETIQLTLTPVDGYKLTEDSLKVNGLPVLGTSFVMPDKTAVVTAFFMKVPRLSGLAIGGLSVLGLGLVVGLFLLIRQKRKKNAKGNAKGNAQSKAQSPKQRRVSGLQGK